MKRTRQTASSHKKTAIITWISVAAIIILLGVYLVGFRGSLFGWAPFASATSDDSVIYPNDDPENDQAEKGSGSTQTTDEIPVSDSLKVSISNLSQADGYITFSGITNDTKAAGKCSIEFSNPNDRPVVRTIDAESNTEGATCGPVKIPETEFSYLGDWTATFRYYSGDVQAVAESKVTIR